MAGREQVAAAQGAGGTETAREAETAGEAESGTGELRARIIEVLRTIYDPEIPVDIWALGLVYVLDVSPAGGVEIEMTLTAPGCPVAGHLLAEVERKVAQVDGVAGVHVELSWDPQWTPDRMSDEAKLTLGMY